MFIKSSYKIKDMVTDSLYGLRPGDVLFSDGSNFSIAQVTEEYTNSVRVQMYRGTSGPESEFAHTSQADELATRKTSLDTYREEVLTQTDIDRFVIIGGGSPFLDELEVLAYIDRRSESQSVPTRLPQGKELLVQLLEGIDKSFGQTPEDCISKLYAAAKRLEAAVRSDIEANTPKS
jgi:hypothetical protein